MLFQQPADLFVLPYPHRIDERKVLPKLLFLIVLLLPVGVADIEIQQVVVRIEDAEEFFVAGDLHEAPVEQERFPDVVVLQAFHFQKIRRVLEGVHFRMVSV